MATITRFVNTDSTAGGDGTTNNTTGATRAYASLSEWNAAEATDLVTATDEHFCECNGSAADTTAVALTGWITGVANRLTIRMLAGQEHGGAWNVNRYRLVVSANFDGFISVNAGAEYVTVQGLQGQNSGTNASHGLYVFTGHNANSDIRFIDNICGFNGVTGTGNGIAMNNRVNFTVVNNVIYGGFNGGIVAGFDDDGNTRVVYNNTVADSAIDGINGFGTGATSDTRMVNNAVIGSGTLDMNLTSGGPDFTANNGTSDTSSPDGASFQSRLFTFVDAPNGNYLHLAGSDAVDVGTDLSSDATFPFSTDIRAVTRVVPWDLGAHEVQTAAGPALSSPTASSITTVGCTPQVTTDGNDGTIYVVAVPDGDVPSVAQIIAGQQSSGAAAPASSNQAVTVTGVQTFAAITSLVHSTPYELYFVHTDAATNDSTASTVGFTTAVDPIAILSLPTALNPTSTVVTPVVTSNEAGGTLYAYAVAGSSQTPTHATIVANAQATSTPVNGVNTMPNITGLAIGSPFTLAFSMVDSVGNESAPVYVNFSTQALTVNVILRNITDGTLFANQTGIEYAVWDQAGLGGIGAPDVQSNTGTTDGSGVLTFSYGASIGQNAIIIARVVVAGADNTNDVWAAGGVLAE